MKNVVILKDRNDTQNIYEAYFLRRRTMDVAKAEIREIHKVRPFDMTFGQTRELLRILTS